MRIAHISILPDFSAGIFKKIEDKANIARQNGLEIDFYLLNPVKNHQANNLFIVKKSYNWLPTVFLKTTAFRLFKMNSLVKAIPLDDYDAIVLRYPLVDGFGYHSYAKKYGHKTFTEHHTDEISELFAVGRKVDRLRAYIEKLYAARFLSKMAGIVAVTDEIRQIELAKTNNPLPSLTLANGINVDSYPSTGFVPFDGNTLDMVFIASKFEPWQGLEGMLNRLEKYPGHVKVNLHLIGELSQEQITLLKQAKNSNISILPHGTLYNDGLNLLMEKANIAISTLFLSKKNMQEACPLKSREYIARGLPFVYAYKDTDLRGNEYFAKRLDEENYSIEEIIAFTQQLSKNTDSIENDFKQHLNFISWKYKLSELEEFIAKILSGSDG